MAFSMLCVRKFCARFRENRDVCLLSACILGGLCGALLACSAVLRGKLVPVSLLCALPACGSDALRLLFANGLFFLLLYALLRLVRGLRLPVVLAFFFGAVLAFSMTLCRVAFLQSGGPRSYFLSTAYLLLRFLGGFLCLHAAVRRAN